MILAHDYIEEALEKSIRIAGPFIKHIKKSTWMAELEHAAFMCLPPCYVCYLPEMPNKAFLMKWRLPTPILDHINGQEDKIYDELMSNWEEKLRSVHSDFLGSNGFLSDRDQEEDKSVDGSESAALVEEEEEVELKSMSNDNYIPDADDESDSNDEFDNGADEEKSPWIKLY
ncbi:hypothetical protein BT96DRAFT_998950 [Gymnopus androsaceus JB14]|uniref:Uncharacterized protein n=1 Tax=Gymnopus androsaceus JB14 TaxID=1447944 RepID=A0A6A4H8C5_9AGAR|nr:hypothetical protein BT96DRAFT_998950 [Gymnopus androsaceus JB14]